MFMLGNAESLVPEGHPIREIERLADEALRRMSGTFDEMYAEDGRDSIPPERLLKAQLLMALYSVRSERQLCEQLPQEGRGAAAGRRRSGKPERRLPRRTKVERDARVDDRPGSEADA